MKRAKLDAIDLHILAELQATPVSDHELQIDDLCLVQGRIKDLGYDAARPGEIDSRAGACRGAQKALVGTCPDGRRAWRTRRRSSLAIESEDEYPGAYQEKQTGMMTFLLLIQH